MNAKPVRSTGVFIVQEFPGLMKQEFAIVDVAILVLNLVSKFGQTGRKQPTGHSSCLVEIHQRPDHLVFKRVKRTEPGGAGGGGTLD